MPAAQKTIVINASPEKVFSVIVDYANYPYDEFDWFCKQGYGSLLKHRWRFLPVELNTEALTINYSQGDRVVVETSRGTLRAEKCILTVSNGVLASGKITLPISLPSKTAPTFFLGKSL